MIRNSVSNQLIIGYLAVSILISRLFQTDAIVVVLSLLSIIVVPFFVGKFVISFTCSSVIEDVEFPIALWAVEWFVGNLIIYLSAGFLSDLGLLNSQLFSYLIILIPAIY